MTDVAGEAVRPAIHLAIPADYRADPCPDLQEEEIVGPVSSPRAKLAEGHEVDLVVHPHARAISRRQVFLHAKVLPSGHEVEHRAGSETSVGELDGTGHGEPDTPHVSSRRVLVEHPIEDRVDAFQDLLGTERDVAGLVVLHEQPTGQIRQPHAKRCCAE